VFLIAFLSASQDVVIDAYRREILAEEEQGLGAAIIVNAYKAASLIPSALGLVMADSQPWQVFWTVPSCCRAWCTLLAKEPALYGEPPKNLQEAVVLPFREFIKRDGWQQALFIIAFVLLYKIGDTM
jgi:PAT family beta-lactamase induction signal transducer AmpG